MNKQTYEQAKGTENKKKEKEIHTCLSKTGILSGHVNLSGGEDMFD